MHQNNLSHHNTSMQAHLSCHLQQQNIQDILHQSKFYLDNRRSHIPESKCFKFQQEIWAGEGDRKIAMKNSKSTSLSNGDVFFRVREGNGRGESKWRAKGAPHLALARPGCAPRHHMVWPACGSPWAAPGASLPLFMRKNFLDIFWKFSRNFIFGQISEFE